MKGFIYAIRSHQTKDIYIGSTEQILCKRMADHRQDYKNWINKKRRFVSSFEIIKYNDVYIELLEEVNVQSKQELQKLEGQWIRKMICVNKRIAGRTDKEYYQENKEQINEKITCDCGSIITKFGLIRHQKTKKHIELMKINY